MGHHAVVIVTYNSAEDILPCLRSLERAPDPATPIVVDNGSTDGTPDWYQESGFGFRLIRLETNVAYAAAANIGAAEALKDPDASCVTFLNPDTVVFPGWLDRMAAHLEDDNVAAVGPLSNTVAGPQKYQAWMPPNDRRARGHAGDVASLLAEANAGRAHEAKLLIGFCTMVSRRAWEELGPFHEPCALGLEDLEWSLRARRAGKRLLIAPDAFVWHRGQRSFRSLEDAQRVALERPSEDALRRRLHEWYGEPVPTADELWGIGWFDTRAPLRDGGR